MAREKNSIRAQMQKEEELIHELLLNSLERSREDILALNRAIIKEKQTITISALACMAKGEGDNIRQENKEHAMISWKIIDNGRVWLMKPDSLGSELFQFLRV